MNEDSSRAVIFEVSPEEMRQNFETKAAINKVFVEKIDHFLLRMKRAMETERPAGDDTYEPFGGILLEAATYFEEHFNEKHLHRQNEQRVLRELMARRDYYLACEEMHVWLAAHVITGHKYLLTMEEARNLGFITWPGNVHGILVENPDYDGPSAEKGYGEVKSEGKVFSTAISHKRPSY